MKNYVIVCIGTPLVLGDSFGPRVGTVLEQHGYTVYGTMKSPLHAKNIDRLIPPILEKHKDDFIIAVDACVTKHEERLYKVRLRDKPIHPGSAIGKRLPVVGHKSLIWLGAVKGRTNFETCINIEKFSDIDLLQRVVDYSVEKIKELIEE